MTYKSRWSDVETREYNSLCDESDRGRNVTEQNRMFLAGLHDAVQAHRQWASEVIQACEWNGARELRKKERKAANTVLVSHAGHIISKTRVIGVNRTDANGVSSSQQTFFDVMTIDELHAKRNEYMTTIRAYDANLATIDKLLALCEVGSASTPAEAAKKLGTSIDDWLGKERAA